MDFGEISTAISTVGFPIVCFFLMYKALIDTQRAHKEEMDKMSEAIHNNTLALTKLSDFLNVKGGDK